MEWTHLSWMENHSLGLCHCDGVGSVADPVVTAAKFPHTQPQKRKPPREEPVVTSCSVWGMGKSHGALLG